MFIAIELDGVVQPPRRCLIASCPAYFAIRIPPQPHHPASRAQMKLAAFRASFAVASPAHQLTHPLVHRRRRC
eukprot:7378167-Prymnesium_polylepis.2